MYPEEKRLTTAWGGLPEQAGPPGARPVTTCETKTHLTPEETGWTSVILILQAFTHTKQHTGKQRREFLTSFQFHSCERTP